MLGKLVVRLTAGAYREQISCIWSRISSQRTKFHLVCAAEKQCRRTVLGYGRARYTTNAHPDTHDTRR